MGDLKLCFDITKSYLAVSNINHLQELVGEWGGLNPPPPTQHLHIQVIKASFYLHRYLDISTLHIIKSLT